MNVIFYRSDMDMNIQRARMTYEGQTVEWYLDQDGHWVSNGRTYKAGGLRRNVLQQTIEEEYQAYLAKKIVGLTND